MEHSFASLNFANCTTPEQQRRLRWMEALQRAATKLNATPNDIIGLWDVPGYGELTEGQLLDVASRV